MEDPALGKGREAARGRPEKRQETAGILSGQAFQGDRLGVLHHHEGATVGREAEVVQLRETRPA